MRRFCRLPKEYRSHSASSSDCRREFVLKGPSPPFSRCQVTPPVALVVIVSTRNHAMINAYLHERIGGSMILHRIDPFWWTHRAGCIKGLESVPPPRFRPWRRRDDRIITRQNAPSVNFLSKSYFTINRNNCRERGNNSIGGPLWRNRSIYLSIRQRYRQDDVGNDARDLSHSFYIFLINVSIWWRLWCSFKSTFLMLLIVQDTLLKNIFFIWYIFQIKWIE